MCRCAARRRRHVSAVINCLRAVNEASRLSFLAALYILLLQLKCNHWKFCEKSSTSKIYSKGVNWKIKKAKTKNKKYKSTTMFLARLCVDWLVALCCHAGQHVPSIISFTSEMQPVAKRPSRRQCADASCALQCIFVRLLERVHLRTTTSAPLTRPVRCRCCACALASLGGFLFAPVLVLSSC